MCTLSFLPPDGDVFPGVFVPNAVTFPRPRFTEILILFFCTFRLMLFPTLFVPAHVSNSPPRIGESLSVDPFWEI